MKVIFMVCVSVIFILILVGEGIVAVIPIIWSTLVRLFRIIKNKISALKNNRVIGEQE